MSRIAGSLLLAISLLASAGCTATFPTVRGPGTVEQQRLRTSVLDLYPEPNMGPEVTGARPPNYQRPRTEVRQAQEFRELWARFFWFGQ